MSSRRSRIHSESGQALVLMLGLVAALITGSMEDSANSEVLKPLNG